MELNDAWSDGMAALRTALTSRTRWSSSRCSFLSWTRRAPSASAPVTSTPMTTTTPTFFHTGRIAPCRSPPARRDPDCAVVVAVTSRCHPSSRSFRPQDTAPGRPEDGVDQLRAGIHPWLTVRSRMPRVARSADSGMIGKMSASFHVGSIVDQS